MKVEVKIVPTRSEPALVIETPALTPAIESLAQRLREEEEGPLLGFQGERAYPLPPEEVTRFYAEAKAVHAQTAAGETYALKLRLYELEERLDKHTFVRISNSEIVNLRQITALDLTLSGTIKMTLRGGAISWVSRRNVKKLKESLGL